MRSSKQPAMWWPKTLKDITHGFRGYPRWPKDVRKRLADMMLKHLTAREKRQLRKNMMQILEELR